MTRRLVAIGCVALAATIVLWVRLLPRSVNAVPEKTWRAEDGREHVYLGDYDSYLWVREARNYLRAGTTCDAVVDGHCRDTLANAPVGAEMRYARSLHIVAIVAVHRAIQLIAPGYPLTSSAYWVPVVMAVAGVLPAYAIATRLAGLVGGFVAAVATGMAPIFIIRAAGSDNDVWNVVLPLCAVWAAVAALGATRRATGAAYGALAGAVVGLHAATWSGWPFTHLVILAGLGATLAIEAMGARSPEDRRRARAVGVILTVYWSSAAAATALAGAGVQALVQPFEILGALVPASSPATTNAELRWPDVLDTVGELSRANVHQIAGLLSAPFYFAVAWVGLLLLVLPERRWRWPHAAALIAGVLLYARAGTLIDPQRGTILLLLSVPIAAAIGMRVVARDPARPRPGTYLVVLWFFAALYEALGASRLILLLVSPFGILLGVALGRVYERLIAMLRPRVGRRLWLAHAVLLAAVGVALAPSVRTGVAAGRAVVPAMQDAWWDTLTRLRETTPPDAIVGAWWDYGHWVKYVAERRVYTDGSTLATHVPHWLGRALLAPTDTETAGLLRMLSCGSDATPTPEGRLGAWGKLVATGIDPTAAYETVAALATLDRDAACARLLAQGVGADTVEDVLASTHCTPPPTYLVLSSRMAARSAWPWIGSWAPNRNADDVAAPKPGFVRPEWSPCTETAGGAWTCSLVAIAGQPKPVVDAVEFRPDAPGRTRLRIATGDRAPAVVLLAGTDPAFEEIAVAHPHEERLGVLVDVSRRRVLVGSPALLRSTFTRLVFLDGRVSPGFELVDDRTGHAGERVRAWRVF